MRRKFFEIIGLREADDSGFGGQAMDVAGAIVPIPCFCWKLTLFGRRFESF